MLLPERLGAGQQGVFQHRDGRTELLPQSSAHCRLHQSFSHSGCSFLLLFSPCYHQKRSESVLIATVSCSSATLLPNLRAHPFHTDSAWVIVLWDTAGALTSGVSAAPSSSPA